MERQLKLIWDFRGRGAAKTAEHHEKHLRDYVVAHGLDSNSGIGTESDVTGHHVLSATYSYAFMIVPESGMPAVRDALKPHRGEVYQKAPHDSNKDASSKSAPNL